VAPELSVAVGWVQVTVVPVLPAVVVAVTSLMQAIVGGVVSTATTLTLNVQVALLPDPSVKVYVTWVVPTLKNVPGKCVLDTDGVAPELSVAVGSVHVTVVPVLPDATVTVTSLMHETVGGVESTE